MGSKVVVAWLLTGEGLVDGVSGNRRAGQGDSIWTVPVPHQHDIPLFSVEGEIGAIKSDRNIPHIYNTRTGEVANPIQVPLQLEGPWYWSFEMMQGDHYQHHRGNARAHSLVTPGGEWVKGCGGKHLLWIPVDWRVDMGYAVWISDIATIGVKRGGSCSYSIVIKLY